MLRARRRAAAFSSTGFLAAELRETVTLYDSKADAKAVVKNLKQAVKNCGDRLEDTGEETRGTTSYGTLDVEDGLALYGVFFAPPQSEFHLQMFAIGRDNNAVVVTAMGQLGRQADAEVSKFTATATKALKKAY